MDDRTLLDAPSAAEWADGEANGEPEDATRSSGARKGACSRCTWLSDPRKFNVLVMSFAFMLLFSAYNSLQNYATSLLPGNLGYWSLSVLYLAVVVVVPFAPAIVSRSGERPSMFVGGALYVLYLATLVRVYEALVLVSSALIGAGAAVLWVAQGAHLTRCSRRGERGFYAGVFWAIFQLNNVAGNLAAYFVFERLSETSLFVMFVILGSAGVLLLLLLRPLRAELAWTADGRAWGEDLDEHPEEGLAGGKASPLVHASAAELPTGDGVEGQSGGGGTSQASRLLRLFRDKRSLLLLLPFAWTGVELAFWTGEFTRLLDEDVIGLVLMWSGVGEIVGSVLVGRLSDRLGRTPLYTIGTAVYGAGLYLAGAVHVRAHWADAPRLESAPWSAYVSAFCFGVGDATFNTQIYAILGQLSHQLGSVELFTVFQLLQNAGSAAGFYVSPYLPLHGDSGTNAQLMLQAGLLASSLISFLAADALVRLAGDEPTEDDSPSDAADAAPMRAADTLSADAETPLR